MKLRQYLDTTNTTIPAFAAEIGVSVQSVHRYLSGQRFPKIDVLRKIELRTQGRVRPNDFISPTDAADAPRQAAA
jgi:transcriptional regulator with XRE-family HTH domain